MQLFLAVCLMIFCFTSFVLAMMTMLTVIKELWRDL